MDYSKRYILLSVILGLLLATECVGKEMEIHGSWVEEREGPTGVIYRMMYHVTCTYELRRKVSNFMVDLLLDTRIDYIKDWSLSLLTVRDDGWQYSYIFDGTAYPPRLVFTFHIGTEGSWLTPSGRCYAPKLGDKRVQPPELTPATLIFPTATWHPCEMMREDSFPGHPDDSNFDIGDLARWDLNRLAGRGPISHDDMPDFPGSRDVMSRADPSFVNLRRRRGVEYLSRTLKRRRRGFIGTRPLPRPNPGWEEFTTLSTTPSTTAFTEFPWLPPARPHPTQESLEEICARYFASKESTTTSSTTTTTSTTWSTTLSSTATNEKTEMTTVRPEIPTSFNYSDALAKSILFYKAQRADPMTVEHSINWRARFLEDEEMSNLDGTGGWYDDGSAVKTTLVTASSVTLLGWGYLAFEEGYQAAGQIEAMRDCIRWPLDYLLKSWKIQIKTQISKVGMEPKNRAFWSRPEELDREIYTIRVPVTRRLDPSKPGIDIAAETASALAIGSLIFKTDVFFAADLLGAALELFDFAHNDLTDYLHDEDSLHYRVTQEARDELCVAAMWLYKASGDDYYLEIATEYADLMQSYTLNYQDKMILCQLLLHEELGSQSVFKNYITEYFEYWLGSSFSFDKVENTPDGLAWYSEDAPLRAAANSAFIALLAADMGFSPEIYRTWALGQIQYMLGKNQKAFSYQIGYGERFPRRPHHRASSCPDEIESCDWTIYNDPDPNPHILTGALVGGPDHNDFHEDCRANFTMNRVAIDFNAGFQSALAGIMQYEALKSTTTEPTKTTSASETTTKTTLKPTSKMPEYTKTTKQPVQTTLKPITQKPENTKTPKQPLQTKPTTPVKSVKTTRQETHKTDQHTTPQPTSRKTTASGDGQTVRPTKVTIDSDNGVNLSTHTNVSVVVVYTCSFIVLYLISLYR